MIEAVFLTQIVPMFGLYGSKLCLIYFVPDQNCDYILLALFSDEVFEIGDLSLEAFQVARNIEDVDGTHRASEESGSERAVLLGLLPKPEVGFRLMLVGHANLLLLVVALLRD